MKHHVTYVTKSWKTSACGLVIAAGQFLVLAPLANCRWLGDWTNGEHRHAFMLTGVAVAVVGSLLLGVASRDHNVSSEQAATKDKRS